MDSDDLNSIGVLETSNKILIDPIWGTDRPEIPFNPSILSSSRCYRDTIKIAKKMKEESNARRLCTCTMSLLEHAFHGDGIFLSVGTPTRPSHGYSGIATTAR
jgi:hypothetical protein